MTLIETPDEAVRVVTPQAAALLELTKDAWEGADRAKAELRRIERDLPRLRSLVADLEASLPLAQRDYAEARDLLRGVWSLTQETLESLPATDRAVGA